MVMVSTSVVLIRKQYELERQKRMRVSLTVMDSCPLPREPLGSGLESSASEARRGG